MNKREIAIEYLNQITDVSWGVWTRGLNGLGGELYTITIQVEYISNILRMYNIVFKTNEMGGRYLVFVSFDDIIETIRDNKINTILNG